MPGELCIQVRFSPRKGSCGQCEVQNQQSLWCSVKDPQDYPSGGTSLPLSYHYPVLEVFMLTQICKYPLDAGRQIWAIHPGPVGLDC